MILVNIPALILVYYRISINISNILVVIHLSSISNFSNILSVFTDIYIISISMYQWIIPVVLYVDYSSGTILILILNSIVW